MLPWLGGPSSPNPVSHPTHSTPPWALTGKSTLISNLFCFLQ